MKKLVTTLLAIVMCSVGCVSPTMLCNADTSNIRGDINQDGKLNTLDLLNVKKCLLGLSSDYDFDTILNTNPQADVDGDGKLSSADLLLLKRILLGFEDIRYMDTTTSKMPTETETYTSSYLSIQIPKGWKVQEGGLEMAHTLVVYDENNPEYQIFVRLKAEPVLKSKASKEYWQFYASYGGSAYQMFADAPYIENSTVSTLYSNFNDFSTWAKSNTLDLSNANLLSINNFKTIQEYNKTVPSYFTASSVMDCKTVVASFNDGKGNSCKGMFSGTIVNFGDYVQDMTWVNDLLGTSFPSSLDTSYYMVYDMAFVTAPSSTFDTDAKILTKCLNSLKYNSEFVKSTNENIQNRTDYFNEVWNS